MVCKKEGRNRLKRIEMYNKQVQKLQHIKTLLPRRNLQVTNNKQANTRIHRKIKN